jgi:hypothetical protein
MPNATIIIPTHNRPQFLPRAVESARAAGRMSRSSLLMMLDLRL